MYYFSGTLLRNTLNLSPLMSNLLMASVIEYPKEVILITHNDSTRMASMIIALNNCQLVAELAMTIVDATKTTSSNLRKLLYVSFILLSFIYHVR